MDENDTDHRPIKDYLLIAAVSAESAREKSARNRVYRADAVPAAIEEPLPVGGEGGAVGQSDKRTGFYQSSLGPLPQDWEIVELRDVADLSRKTSHLSVGKNEIVPFLPMAMIPNNDVYIRNWELRESRDIRSGIFFQEDDLLLAKITPCLENGKLGIAQGIPGGWGIATTEVFPIHPTRVLGEFLALYLKQLRIRRSLAEKMEGTTGRQRLPKAVIESLPLPLPPLPEQRAIASVLITVQRAIAATEQVITAARELKRSLMRHLFTYGPVADGQAAHVSLQETPYGSAPARWNIIELREAVIDIDYGFSAPIPKPQPDSGTKIVSTADITKDGHVLYPRIRRIQAPVRTVDRLTLQTGDILFNWRNSPELIGKTAIFEEQLEPHIFASFVLRIRTDEIKSHNIFLKHLLNYYRDAGVFLSLARRAVNQANYNRNEILALRIPLPRFDEQQEIAGILSAADQKIAAEEARQNALEDLFKTLLHHLMTGRLRVPLETGPLLVGAV